MAAPGRVIQPSWAKATAHFGGLGPDLDVCLGPTGKLRGQYMALPDLLRVGCPRNCRPRIPADSIRNSRPQRVSAVRPAADPARQSTGVCIGSLTARSRTPRVERRVGGRLPATCGHWWFTGWGPQSSRQRTLAEAMSYVYCPRKSMVLPLRLNPEAQVKTGPSRSNRTTRALPPPSIDLFVFNSPASVFVPMLDGSGQHHNLIGVHL